MKSNIFVGMVLMSLCEDIHDCVHECVHYIWCILSLPVFKSSDEKLEQFTEVEGSLPASFWKLRK